MATRREAREWCTQMLFQLDLNPTENIDNAITRFWSDKQPDSAMKEFSEKLLRGVRSNMIEIDNTIQKYADNWHMDRMAAVDRNVMRMAVYEMLFCRDIPPVVSINEAVDIAKYFGSRESGRFVNGILDRIRKDIDRPARCKDE